MPAGGVVVLRRAMQSELPVQIGAEVFFIGQVYKPGRKVKFIISWFIFLQNALHRAYIIVMYGTTRIVRLHVSVRDPHSKRRIRIADFSWIHLHDSF